MLTETNAEDVAETVGAGPVAETREPSRYTSGCFLSSLHGMCLFVLSNPHLFAACAGWGCLLPFPVCSTCFLLLSTPIMFVPYAISCSLTLSAVRSLQRLTLGDRSPCPVAVCVVHETL